jgi:hypothetical protein
MEMRRLHTKKYLMAILVLVMIGISGCEGLDDWSDLQVGDLFDDNSADAKGDVEFKRYAEVGMSNQPVVEFLVDAHTAQSKFYAAQIQKSCDYTKIPFRATNIKSFAVPANSTRVVALLDTKKLSDAAIAKLMDFVANGGTLFVPFASEDKRMGFLYGFKPEAEFGIDTKAAGYRYTTPILPTLKGMTNYEDVPLFGFEAKNFSSNIKILATAANNPNYPSVIENPIGKGKVILFNSSSYVIKQDRGFLFAGLLKGLEAVPYPVANVSTMFLDDFPSPLYNIKAEPIASELNLTMSEYVTKVWWPDMKKVAKEFNLKYSAMIAFDYKNKTVPPFVFDQWNSTKIKTKDKVEPMSDWLMRDVDKNGHELSLHGYNHVEFTAKDWKNQEFIQLALQSVKKKWDAGNFGPMPKTYVPPSNIIDSKGVVALKKGMPSIKYMCSLYLGETHEGGNREFDYDPFNKELFDYPRISSGFYMTNEEKYILQSEYILTGIWNHFVHPDDVFQIPATANASAGDFDLRNKLSYGWYKTKGKDKAMLPEFRKYLGLMTTTYPQLRFVTGGEGGKLTIDWRASRYEHKKQNGVYSVNEINPDANSKQYWFMYGSPQNAARIEAQLKGQNVLFSKSPCMDGYLYSVYSNKPNLSSIDLLYKTPQQKLQALSITQSVKADFAKYKDAMQKFMSGAIWVDNTEKNFKIELAALKNRMLNEPKIDSVAWNKYAKYMSWEDRGEEVWKMLDEHVMKYPTAENVMYSKELDRVIGYPNDMTKEKWMRAQMLVTPNDKDLLNSYVANFYTDENQENIRKALKQLLALDTSSANYVNYIKHLLQYDPPEALKELSDRKASDEFGEETATSIVWLFADNDNYAKAYEWSAYAKDIDFVTKMNWLIEMKNWKLLEKEYLAYIAEHPDDYKAKGLMANVYHEQGRFKDSWVLANSLPESPEKEELRKTLNTDVVFEQPELQQDLLANHSELFYPNILKSLAKENRLKYSDYVDVDSYYETNQDNPAVFKNRASYNLRDKKGNIHTAGLTYSQYYKLDINERFPYNTNNSLKGIEYKFQKAENPDVDGQIQYWGRARFEIDDNNKGYYQFGIGASRGKNKRFTSAEFNIMPVETAAGMNQGIYNARLNVYKDMYLFKVINASVSLEGNYYTNGLLSIDTITVEPPVSEEKMDPNARKTEYNIISPTQYTITEFDDALEAAATVRFAYDKGDEKKSKFIPFLEGQYSIGSLDQSVGYPYWMIKERLYGGGGLGWAFGLENFKSKVEAAYFLDDYSKNFQRYTGSLQYQLFDYTALTLNFEFFSQDKYYSNSVQLGVKYNLKKKVKRK